MPLSAHSQTQTPQRGQTTRCALPSPLLPFSPLPHIHTHIRSLSLSLSLQQQQQRTLLLKDSHSEFKLYATGRRCVDYMHASIDLKRRQDLISVLYDLVATHNDTLTVEIALNTKTDPLIFAVVNNRIKRAMREEWYVVRLARRRARRPLTASPRSPQPRSALLHEGLQLGQRRLLAPALPHGLVAHGRARGPRRERRQGDQQPWPLVPLCPPLGPARRRPEQVSRVAASAVLPDSLLTRSISSPSAPMRVSCTRRPPRRPTTRRLPRRGG